MGMLDTSLSEINKVVGKKLTYDELEELLFEFGLDIKGAEGDALKIELTPDRYDMLSVQGFGRALRAYLGIEKGMPKYNVASCNSCRDEQHKIEKYPSYVEVVEPISEWPCVVAFIVKGLEFNDEKIREIIQIQEKLGELLLKKRKKGGIGIYPLDKITFPVKFTAQKPENIVFQPLEFEREINGHQILSQHPTGRKYAYICENWEKFPVFIDAKNTIMSMPPIINSHNVGKIDENTNAIFFEATGPDLLRLKQVANIFAAVFSDMGGKVYSLDVKYKTKTITTPDMSPFVREVSIKNAEKVLGVKLSKDEAIKLLQRMMYDVKDARAIKNEKGEIVDEIITLLAPAFRTDLLHEIDIIDDIGRAYGYDNIKPTFPNVSTVGSTLPKSDFCEKISEIFVGLGFQEIVTFILTNTHDQYTKMNLKEDNFVPVVNATETAINSLRTNIFPELLKVLENNQHNPYPQKIFEVGFVAIPNETVKDVRCRDVRKLSCLIADNKADFTQAKQNLDAVMRLLGVKYNVLLSDHPSFDKERQGKIIIGKTEIGVIGEISKDVLKKWNFRIPVVGFELNLDDVFEIEK